MNLVGFSGGLYASIGSFSISMEFSSIVDELLKRAFCVLDSGMSRYYLIFGPQTSVFPFVRYQNVVIVLVFVDDFISVIRGQSHIFVISIMNYMKFPISKKKFKIKNYTTQIKFQIYAK